MTASSRMERQLAALGVLKSTLSDQERSMTDRGPELYAPPGTRAALAPPNDDIDFLHDGDLNNHQLSTSNSSLQEPMLDPSRIELPEEVGHLVKSGTEGFDAIIDHVIERLRGHINQIEQQIQRLETKRAAHRDSLTDLVQTAHSISVETTANEDSVSKL